MTPLPPQRYVRRWDPVLARFGLSERLVRRYQDQGRLSKIKTAGVRGPVFVDLREVAQFFEDSRESVREDDTTDHLDALLSRYASTGDAAAHLELCAIVRRIDAVLWGDHWDDL